MIRSKKKSNNTSNTLAANLLCQIIQLIRYIFYFLHHCRQEGHYTTGSCHYIARISFLYFPIAFFSFLYALANAASLKASRTLLTVSWKHFGVLLVISSKVLSAPAHWLVWKPRHIFSILLLLSRYENLYPLSMGTYQITPKYSSGLRTIINL